MASRPTTNEAALKLLQPAGPAAHCPHDEAYLTLTGDAFCPTCGQVAELFVKDSAGVQHWRLLWVRSGTPAEHITCGCRRTFHAGVLNGLKTPRDAFLHHMAAMDEGTSKG